MKPYTEFLIRDQLFEMRLSEAQTVLVKYKIGEGGFGEVWRVTHPEKVKDYALKHINVPLLIHKRRIVSGDKATLLERIKREASIRVESPYVTTCYGYREIKGNFFLLSDFVFGDSFGEWIRSNPGTAWNVKKALFLKILEGIRDLHRAGIVHRDLKPSNILITQETQTPKIIDFGLAKLDDSMMTISGDFSGSRFYKDPSLIRGWKGIKAGDRASDVYALGLLLYELIVGQNPWEANGLRYEEIFHQITGKDNVLDLDRRFQLRADPAEAAAVQNVIRLSTRFDRSARLQSVEEMIRLLSSSGHIGANVPPPSPEKRQTAPPPGPSPGPNGKSRRRWPGLLFAGLVILMMIFWAIDDNQLLPPGVLSSCGIWGTPTPTPTPGATATPQAHTMPVIETPTPEPTATPTFTPTPTPEPTATPTVTPTPTPEPTATPTLTPEPTATPTFTPTPTPEPTPTPTFTPTPTPEPTATPQPTATPTPVPQLTLTLRSNVFDDAVYLDGEYVGSTRLDLALPAGTYLVRVEKEECEAEEISVNLNRDRTVWARLTCATPTPEPSPTPTPPLTVRIGALKLEDASGARVLPLRDDALYLLVPGERLRFTAVEVSGLRETASAVVALSARTGQTPDRQTYIAPDEPGARDILIVRLQEAATGRLIAQKAFIIKVQE